MANSAQARKRARQADVARARNASQRSAFRTAIKKFWKAGEAAIKPQQTVFQESVASSTVLRKETSTRTRPLVTRAACLPRSRRWPEPLVSLQNPIRADRVFYCCYFIQRLSPPRLGCPQNGLPGETKQVQCLCCPRNGKRVVPDHRATGLDFREGGWAQGARKPGDRPRIRGCRFEPVAGRLPGFGSCGIQTASAWGGCVQEFFMFRPSLIAAVLAALPLFGRAGCRAC